MPHSASSVEGVFKRFGLVYAVATLPLVLKHLRKGNSRALFKFDSGSAKIAELAWRESAVFDDRQNNFGRKKWGRHNGSKDTTRKAESRR